MQWYVFVIGHIYVDALKLWKLGEHWKHKSIQCLKTCCWVVEQVVFPKEFTWIFYPRGSFCFLGTWLNLGLIPLLQKCLEYYLVEMVKATFHRVCKTACMRFLFNVCITKDTFESGYYLFLYMYPLKMNVSKNNLHMLTINTAFH